jgi:hypothetical protein
MTNDPVADELDRVLTYGGPERVWPAPPSAVITPGTGENIWHGLIVTHWSTDA